MTLSQIELVCLKFRIKWECFWVNLREDNKVSESKMAVSEFNMTEFKMAAIIKLSLNEWVKFFLCKWREPILASVRVFERKTKMPESKKAKFKMAEFKMAAIIKLSENEWFWVRLNYFGSESEWSESVFEWIWEKITRVRIQCDSVWIFQDGCYHQVEWEWMSLSQIKLLWVRVLGKMVESKMAKFKMAEFKVAAFIKLSETEWVWVRLN